MGVGLVSDLDPCGAGVAELADGNEMYLVVEPESAGYVVLGPTLRLLEVVHPRLPLTFFNLFTHALNRWVRVYDYRDAAERVEQLREWYEGDPEGETVELPDVDGRHSKVLAPKVESTQRAVRRAVSRNREKPEDPSSPRGSAGTQRGVAARGEAQDYGVDPGAIGGLEPAGTGLGRSV